MQHKLRIQPRVHASMATYHTLTTAQLSNNPVLYVLADAKYIIDGEIGWTSA